MVTMKDAIRFGNAPKTSNDSEPESTSQELTYENGSSKIMSERDIIFTQLYVRHEMLNLGYSLNQTHLSFHKRLLFYLVDWPVNRIGMAAWQAFRSNN
jgi:hypothetical protein